MAFLLSLFCFLSPLCLCLVLIFSYLCVLPLHLASLVLHVTDACHQPGSTKSLELTGAQNCARRVQGRAKLAQTGSALHCLAHKHNSSSSWPQVKSLRSAT